MQNEILVYIHTYVHGLGHGGKDIIPSVLCEKWTHRDLVNTAEFVTIMQLYQLWSLCEPLEKS